MIKVYKYIRDVNRKLEFNRFTILMKDKNEDDQREINGILSKESSDLVFIGGFGRKGHK